MSHDDSANDPMNFVKNMWGNMGFSCPAWSPRLLMSKKSKSG